MPYVTCAAVAGGIAMALLSAPLGAIVALLLVGAALWVSWFTWDVPE